MFHTNLNILAVTPFANCNIPNYILGGCLTLLIPSSSALFFLRVKAVYRNNRIVTTFFGLLWFVLFGLCFVLPLSAKSVHIPTTQVCIIIRIEYYASIPLIAHSVFDTLVFIANSVRILSFSIVGGTFGARMRSFFRGDGLPWFSRNLLLGGHLYYVFVICLLYDRYALISSV
jgi:hypothetical protein